MTEKQLTAEVYGAISGIVPTFWVSRPTSGQDFPLVVYQKLDVSTDYSFGITRSAESHVFQIDYYEFPSEIERKDDNFDLIKTAMEAIDYRLIGSNAEFVDTELNKVIKTSRWERYNV